MYSRMMSNRMMCSRTCRHLLIALCAAILLGLTARPGAAQQWRSEGFYLKPQLGLNSYDGDRSGSGLLGGAPGPSTGLEAGYRTRAGALSTSLGLYLLSGRYPALMREPEGAPALNPGELERWRHTLSLVGQVGFAPEARLSPYVRLGAGTTLGVTDGEVRLAFSPLGGVGLDVAVTPQVGLFVEATGLLSLPDDQFDWAEGLDDRRADALGFLGIGVRIDLSRPFTPVQVFTAEGPTRLDVGEEARFVARANEEEATGPVAYQWDLGDGTTATGPAVTHRFDRPGNYTLRLTGRNEGSADTQLLTVTVVEATAGARADAREAPASETVVTFPDSLTDRENLAGRDRLADQNDEARRGAPDPAAQAQRNAQREALAEAPPLSCDDVIELNATYFEERSADLNAKGRQAIEENVAVLEQCPGLRVRLEAFAAPDESRELAAARARTVEQRYVQSGIAAARITEPDLRQVEQVTTKFSAAHALRRVESRPVRPAQPALAPLRRVTGSVSPEAYTQHLSRPQR